MAFEVTTRPSTIASGDAASNASDVGTTPDAEQTWKETKELIRLIS